MNRLMLPLAFMLMAFTVPLHAEQSAQFGDYVVHYNAFTADVLDPKVAQGVGIQRSRNRGVLMVNVQRAGAGTKPLGVPAKLTVTAQTLNLQAMKIEMRPVREGESYYYISDFPVSNGQTLDFSITVQPEGAKAPNTITYRQQFFTKP